MKVFFKSYFFIAVAFQIFFSGNILNAADSTAVSFQKQNAKKNFISISFGMGVNYCNNPSLVNFIGDDVPNYEYIPNNEKVSDYSSAIQFFGAVEFQIKKNFSVKPEYSYQIKSISVASNSNYQYNYTANQPMLMLNYIFAQKHSYIKMGIGGGYFFYSFTRKYVNTESNYNSSGAAIKTELTLNAQLSTSTATYLSGFLMQSFSSDLKNDDGAYLLSTNGDKVNLNSFGLGVRLGVEIFIF